MIWLITSPQFPATESNHNPALSEIQIIESAFGAGLQTLLLRKPGWSAHAYAQWLEQLPARYHNRVMTATHPSLVETYGLKGLHLSEDARARIAPYEIRKLRDAGRCISASIHNGTTDTSAYDAVLLGPVFDSISKPGHNARQFDTIPPNALALGGVHAGNITEVKERGFCGAAVLGAVWQHPDPVQAVALLTEMLNLWQAPIPLLNNTHP